MTNNLVRKIAQDLLAARYTEIAHALQGACGPAGTGVTGMSIARHDGRPVEIDGRTYGMFHTVDGDIPLWISKELESVHIGCIGEINFPFYDAMLDIVGDGHDNVDEVVNKLKAAYELLIKPDLVALRRVQGCPECASEPVKESGLVQCDRCDLIQRCAPDYDRWDAAYRESSGSYFRQLAASGQSTVEGAHGYEDYEEWARVILGASWFDFRAQLISSWLTSRPAHPESLDIGCATGEMAAALWRMGFAASGVDLNPWAISRAQALYPEISCSIGDSDAVARQRYEFDVITYLDVFEHIPSPHAELAIARSLLRPGGMLFLELPNQGSLDAHVLGADYLFAEHLFFYTPVSIRSLLERNGFEVTRMLTCHDRYFGIDRFFSADSAESIEASGQAERLLVGATKVA
jgi:SAM-dependent methyltransferase